MVPIWSTLQAKWKQSGKGNTSKFKNLDSNLVHFACKVEAKWKRKKLGTEKKKSLEMKVETRHWNITVPDFFLIWFFPDFSFLLQ